MVQWKTLVEEEKSCFLLVMVKKKKKVDNIYTKLQLQGKH